MTGYDNAGEPHIATIDVDQKRLNVSVRIVYDGIEYVGRLWFAEDGWDDTGIPDRGAFPGRTKEEVVHFARRLVPHELAQRYRRALSERRRFIGLRRLTDEILTKIRYLNQVAISMRAGLLDVEGAAGEIDLTERQLHELIDRLRTTAGVEDA